jgi:hypothetical protein
MLLKALRAKARRGMSYKAVLDEAAFIVLLDLGMPRTEGFESAPHFPKCRKLERVVRG